MSKLKVGDWVICKSEVGRIVEVCNNEEFFGVALLDKTLKFISKEELTKLPVKFKPFEINRNLQVYETRVIKGHEYPIQFMSTDDNFAAFSYCKKGIMFGTMGCKPCITRDQAKDWLELQYATMLCKARGLI